MLRLKEIRKRNGLSQEQLARLLDVTQATLSGWENEKYEIDNNSLIKCADFFDVTVDYLLGRECQPSEKAYSEGIYTPTTGLFIHFLKNMKNISYSDISQLTNIEVYRLKDIVIFNSNATDEEIEKIASVLGSTSYMLKNRFIPSDMSEPYIPKLGRELNESDYMMLELYENLDFNDKAEIRGEMKQMLKSDKYSDNAGDSQVTHNSKIVAIGTGKAVAHGGESVEKNMTQSDYEKVRDIIDSEYDDE